MNCPWNFCIQLYQQQRELVKEQVYGELNPVYEIANERSMRLM